MAKKKASSVTVKRAKKTLPKKKVGKSKSAKPRSSSTTKVKKATRPAAKRKTPSQPAAKKKASSLGRPHVAGDARLDQFFTRDYEARQVFDFLNVTTIRELEAYSPDEIIERLTAPVVQTVERIRKALAMNNRCLSNDREYAVQFKHSLKP